MNAPLVSVIIPTFNAAAKLQASLRSVTENQAPFQDVEVLVMDGASVDETVQVARDFAFVDERVQVWSESDNGIYDAMNRGIERSNGRFLYFLGAGDTLRAGVLGELETLPDLHPRLLLHAQVSPPVVGAPPHVSAGLKLVDLARFNIPHQGAFYGREIFRVVGLYEPKYRIYADHDLNFRCWADKRIETRFWNRVVADFELGGASASRHDPQFERDWPRLVWKRGGMWPWLSLQSRRFTPQQLRFLQKLRSFARGRWKW